MDYHVGQGQQYPTINSTPLHTLLPGDKVYVHPGIYKEHLFANRSGKDWSAPVEFIGIKDAQGNKPIIDGANAVSGHVPGTFVGEDTLGVVLLARAAGDAWGARPHHIRFKDLYITGGKAGNTFTDWNGNVVPYAGDACGFAGYYATDIELDGIDFDRNGNGSFCKSGGSVEMLSERWNIHDCRYYGNGVSGSDKQHQSYHEVASIRYHGNYYGPLVAGSKGSALKDRSIDVWIDGCEIWDTARALDLVDPEDGQAAMAGRPGYDDKFVWGNTFRIQASGYPLHSGGDTGFVDQYPKNLWCAHNDLLIEQDALQNYRVVLFSCPTNRQYVNVWNNIVRLQSKTPGARTPILELMDQYGSADFGPNWITAGWMPWNDHSTAQGTIAGLNNIITEAHNDPGFTSYPTILTLKAGASAAGKAGPLQGLWIGNRGGFNPDLGRPLSGPIPIVTPALAGAVPIPIPVPVPPPPPAPTGAYPVRIDGPSTMRAWTSFNIKVYLDRAGTTGTVVNLSSSATALLTVPASVTIPAGWLSLTVNVAGVGKVTAPTPVVLAATANGGFASLTVTVMP